MPRIVKTLNDGRDSVIEVIVNAISETTAQKRAEIYFKTRFPSKIGKIKEISLLEEPTDDIVKEYRVSIVFESGDLFNEISK